MATKKYANINDIVTTLRRECTGYNLDGSKKFPIDWALTNGTVLDLCTQIKTLHQQECKAAYEEGLATGISQSVTPAEKEGILANHPHDWGRVKKLLHNIHDFLAKICREGKCDTHCSTCHEANIFADEVWELIESQEEMPNEDR